MTLTQAKKRRYCLDYGRERLLSARSFTFGEARSKPSLSWSLNRGGAAAMRTPLIETAFDMKGETHAKASPTRFG